jgi:hypothetical protein
MPKCAGSSMKSVLHSNFKGNWISDYNSFFKTPKPSRDLLIYDLIKSPIPSIPKDAFVFGHFFPVKYIGNSVISKEEVKLITFLRDPVERLSSHYAFWKSGDFSDHYLWRTMIKENWSFARFALSQEMRNFYSQYLTQVPISYFDFVGIHENIEKDWRRLCDYLKIKRQSLPITNTSKSDDIKSKIDSALLKDIKEFHSEDYLVYNYFASQIIRPSNSHKE